MKDINREINRLKAIKSEIERLHRVRRLINNPHFLSQFKYEELARDNKINDNELYFIVEPEIGQYMEDYMDNEDFKVKL